MADTSDWMGVGDSFYRKAELYSLEWGGGLNVSKLILSAAPYGGPIAMTWPQEGGKTKQAPGKPIIIIFTAAGKRLATIQWGSTALISLGWSDTENLVCVHQDGAVSVYDMFGTYKHTFSMGEEAKDAGILSAKVFEGLNGTGIAILTSTYRLYVIANIKDPNPRRYSDIPSGEVHCWGIIKEDRSLSVVLSQSKALCWSNLSDSRANVLQVPLITEGVEENAVISLLAICSNQRHIALLSTTGKLWIGSIDLVTRYCLYDTKSCVKPRQIVWCGTGCVLIAWEVALQLITITGDVTTFCLDSPAHLIQEIDSVRVIANTTHDILYKIPHVTAETLQIGSMASGGLLVQAHIEYVKDSPRAYDCLTMIKGREEEGVEQCLQAAKLDMEQQNIELLMKSALFGISLLSNFDNKVIRETATKLRILNDLRTKKIGIPLTWTQLERLTVPVVLERLVARRLFPVALIIAKTVQKMGEGLQEGTEQRILAHWACYKISHTTNVNDDTLAQMIHNKLGYTPGISYTEVANWADKVNRRELAVRLLGYESRSKEQVTGLLKLGETKAALSRAQKTGDTDLIHTVLQHIKDTLPLADFLMLVSGSMQCKSVYTKSCQGYEGRDALSDLYVQEDDFHAQANLKIREAYEANRTEIRLGLLQSGGECFRRDKDDFSTAMTEDQVKLLRCQVGLESVHQKNFVNLSLNETLTLLLLHNQTKEADKVKVDFKVNDKRYWYLRVSAHAQANHWEQLEAFYKSKKTCPVPAEVFVDACVKNGNVGEARKYVNKVKDENKVQYLRKCGLDEEADKLAESSNSASPLAKFMGVVNVPSLF